MAQNVMYQSGRHRQQTPSVSEQAVLGFWNDACHYKATASLVQVRQLRKYRQDIVLEQAIQGPIVSCFDEYSGLELCMEVTYISQIRACILRKEIVPEWLQTVTVRGETSQCMKLQSLMARLAELQYQVIQGLENCSSDKQSRSNTLDFLFTKARELDLAFALWPETIFLHSTVSSYWIRSDWTNYETSIVEQNIICKDEAAVWMHYWASWIVLDSLCIDLMLDLAPNMDLYRTMAVFASRCRETVNIVAGQMCNIVQSFLNQNPCQKCPIQMRNDCSTDADVVEKPLLLQIDPKMATLMAWPLVVAIRTGHIPIAQRQILQCGLKLVADIIGASVLHLVAENKTVGF